MGRLGHTTRACTNRCLAMRVLYTSSRHLPNAFDQAGTRMACCVQGGHCVCIIPAERSRACYERSRACWIVEMRCSTVGCIAGQTSWLASHRATKACPCCMHTSFESCASGSHDAAPCSACWDCPVLCTRHHGWPAEKLFLLLALRDVRQLPRQWHLKGGVCQHGGQNVCRLGLHGWPQAVPLMATCRSTTSRQQFDH